MSPHEDMQKIGVCFVLAFVDKEEFKEQGKIFEALDVADQQKMLDEFASDMQGNERGRGGLFWTTTCASRSPPSEGGK